MRISEVARLTGLAPSAIRYYEEHDMFSPGQVVRTSNRYRDYTQDALRRLELVQAGRDAGFSLAEMKSRMRNWDALPDDQRVEILVAQLEVIDERIQRLAQSRRTVNEALQTLNALLDAPRGPVESGAPMALKKIVDSDAGAMMYERYYTSAWEWECCGGPLRVGDAAELEVQYDSDYAESMRSELANELPEPLTGVESHHDDESVVQNGRIVALDAVIADAKWVVTPRATRATRMQPLGDGSFASFGNTAPGQAEGENMKGTSRLVPVSVLPDEAAVPEGAGPDLTVFGEQISPELTGFVITIEVFEERQISDYH